jgi:hypothetical protein
MESLKELKDIKSIEVINVDYDLYLIALGGIIFVLIIVLYFIFRKKKIITKRDIAIKNLKNLNFENDIKQIAYDFTVYGQECLEEKYKDDFYLIVDKLEEFKYKKNIDNIVDKALIDSMKSYIKLKL